MHKRLDLGHVISMTPIGCSLGSSVDQVLTKWPTQQCHSRWQHLTFGLAFPGHINAHDCPAQKWLIAPKLRSAHRQGLFIPDYSYPKEVDHTWGFIIYHSFIYYSLLQKNGYTYSWLPVTSHPFVSAAIAVIAVRSWVTWVSFRPSTNCTRRLPTKPCRRSMAQLGFPAYENILNMEIWYGNLAGCFKGRTGMHIH